jgi:uncharacterized protein (DUF2147 family)
MKPHAFTAAMGILVAAALVPASFVQAASADPTGIWRKAQQGERPGKFEIFRCGSGKRYLCAKIVWLQDPLDSHGRPLHDVRNENPSMRDRPILGLPIMQGLAPVGRSQWKGSIYNPEDGNTYSVTLTQVSRDKIHIKGCKAWLLCGERWWLRSSLPKPEPKEEPQIEASAEPDATAQPASATAAAEPEKPAAKAEADVFADAQMLTPAVEGSAQPGYRFLNASATSKPAPGLSGENVPSMFVMNTPLDREEVDQGTETTKTAAADPAPKPAVPAPKPKPQAIQASAAPAPKPQAAPVAPAPEAAAVPAEADSQSVDTAEAETAETASIEEAQPLTRRERRRLRRQQRRMEHEGQGLLPWLR